MSETYPERTNAKRFSQDIFPPSVGFGCKGTTKFADVQILSGKSFRSFKSFKGERRRVCRSLENGAERLQFRVLGCDSHCSATEVIGIVRE